MLDSNLKQFRSKEKLKLIQIRIKEPLSPTTAHWGSSPKLGSARIFPRSEKGVNNINLVSVSWKLPLFEYTTGAIFLYI